MRPGVGSAAEQDWEHLKSNRATLLQPSPFVDLAPMMEHQDLIFFGGGTPPPAQVPVERLRQASADTWEDAREIFNYSESSGHLPLRQLISNMLARRGIDAGCDRILITNGSQQGIDLIARSLLDSGDQVVVEGPTYFGAMQALDAYEIEYLVAPIDDDGIVPDALEQLLRTNDRVKFIYTVSIFQNPTGVTMTEDRMRQIIEIAKRYGVAIVEDDPYGDLAFAGDPPRPLAGFDANVIYLGTFSKTIMPALRTGWMVFPPALGPSLLDGKEAVDIQSDRFVQRMIVRAARDGWLDRHIDESRHLYGMKCRTMVTALKCSMPEGVTWKEPGGGFFLWLQLPDGMTARTLLPAAVEHSVGFLPGYFFYPDRRPTPALRLGFTTLSDADIEQGIDRLGDAIRSAMD